MTFLKGIIKVAPRKIRNFLRSCLTVEEIPVSLITKETYLYLNLCVELFFEIGFNIVRIPFPVSLLIKSYRLVREMGGI